ncbi:MAG: cupin domain-containing protein [Gordonia sp. (in: high G+C Gram-positive bacteria)]|uniref:cupin domain-containing protein n=1 Tax=Gordonia sp. (in: high G+C Gram-positive bacteria) TaxID=84139 RepID=UPI0039E60E3F
MPHLTADDARTFELHGVRFHSFAASHSGTRRLAAWRADFPPHTTGTPHSMTEEEVLHVLDGRLDVELDDERFTAATGEAILVPAGTTLCVSNSSPEPARAWVTTTLGMNAVMGDGQRVAPPWAQ